MYPTISEYLEAIKSAEDNFDQLKHLRPVLEDDGSPIMTSGNFAVVFKMKDEQTGKLHAVKCFLREQEGRAEAYRMIAEELEFVSSTFLTPIKYLDKELFVDTNAGDEQEFPVLLMDWVEGETLDKYIRKHLDDQYELSLIAYQFSRLAMWLMPQPFAHGDLKPDNILVKSNGTLVLVDYDGMYVPAMKGQKARELGSPDFRHPSRTETDFDEHIDDFSLASILLSLKAIALQSSLLEEYGAQDRLLFSEKDYRNLSESKVMDALKPLMQDAELASLYSLFILAASQNNLSGVSFRLFYLNRPSVSSPKKSMRVLQINKKIVNQSNQKIIKKELLASFQGKKNVWHILLSNGTSSYLTQDWSFNYEASAKGACKLNTVENDKKHVLFLFNDRDAEVGRYYIGEKLRGLTPKQLTEIKHELCFFEAWNPETNKWVPCVGKSKDSVKKQKLKNEDQRTEVTDEELDAWAAAIEDNMPYDNERCWPLLEFAKAHGKMQVGEFMDKQTNKKFKSCIFTNNAGTRIFVAFSAGLGELTPKEIAAQKDDLIVVKHESGNYSLCRREQQEENLSTEVTDEDLENAWTDEYGVMYSTDRKRLLRAPKDISEYSVREGTKVICDGDICRVVLSDNKKRRTITKLGEGAFNKCEALKSISFPRSLIKIGDSAFRYCKSLSHIVIPDSVKEIGNRAFGDCSAIKECVLSKSLSFIGDWAFRDCKCLKRIVIQGPVDEIGDYAFGDCKELESVTLPNSVSSIGNYAFDGCKMLSSIVVPTSLRKIGIRAFRGCESLEYFDMPDSVSIIGIGAFEKCRSLKMIKIPTSIEKIEEWAFQGCKSISTITIPNSINEIGDCAFLGCDSLEIIHIPNSVKTIGNSSFNDCKLLKQIIIPDSVVKIGNYAFANCVSLIQIDIPDSVKEIGKNPLSLCKDINVNCSTYKGNALYSSDFKKLISYIDKGNRLFEVPNSVNEIGNSAFYECGNLTQVIIPDSVKRIKREAFGECWNLKAIIIPSSVTHIEDTAFLGCRNLSNVKILNPNILLEKWSFKFCNTNLIISVPIGTKSKFQEMLPSQLKKKIVEHDEVENLSAEVTDEDLENAWMDEFGVKYSNDYIRLLNAPYDIENYTIRTGTLVICDNAFSGCSSLTSIIIADNVLRIGKYAFEGCPIQKVVIPESVISIGDKAFSDCTELEQLTIPSTIKYIGDEAFYNCRSLQTIIIPKGVVKIGRNPFARSAVSNIICDSDFFETDGIALYDKGRNKLISVLAQEKSYVIPDSVTTIGDAAFFDSSIQSLVIPNSVTSIGGNAFTCSSIQTISIPDSVALIGRSAFRFSSIKSIRLSNNLKCIGAFCFNSTHLQDVVIPDGVTEIESQAFSCCLNLEKVFIPYSVSIIGDAVFYNCPKLKSIIIPTGMRKKFEVILSDYKNIIVEQ